MSKKFVNHRRDSLYQNYKRILINLQTFISVNNYKFLFHLSCLSLCLLKGLNIILYFVYFEVKCSVS